MRRRTTGWLESPDVQPILSRLGVTGSLRRELEALLAEAPPDASSELLRDLIVERNVAGKASKAQRLQVWWRLKLRYVLDPAVAEYRAFRVALDATANQEERGLLDLLMFARTDRLFREATQQCISPWLYGPEVTVDPDEVHTAIRSIAEAHGQKWSSTTLLRSRGHLLSSLKDFGVLRGRASKRTTRPRPGVQVALFAARLARLEGLTDRQLLEARWFKLLGLDRAQVADLLYTAARAGALRFRMQADVVELDLPPLEAASTDHTFRCIHPEVPHAAAR